MAWAFAAGLGIGLLLGVVVTSILMVPKFFTLVTTVVESVSKAVRFPGGTQVFMPHAPTPEADVFADLERDNERVPSWMDSDEGESVAP